MKKELIREIKERIGLRIAEAQKAMDAAQSSANEETKSSAGDKYETGRAMAQNDRDMYARQLHEAQAELGILESINPAAQYQKVGLGSLVETSIGFLFLAVSVGVIKLRNTNVMVLSPESPLGKAVLGQAKGASVLFRDKTVTLLDVS